MMEYGGERSGKVFAGEVGIDKVLIPLLKKLHIAGGLYGSDGYTPSNIGW
jgi:hypothetical protein